jgi:hypothetical protein
MSTLKNTVIVGILAAACSGLVSLAAQAPDSASASWNAAEKPWTPPRTPWGDPDISGVFTNVDEQGIPLERPREFGERTTLTDEEFAAREAAARRQRALDVAPFSPETTDALAAGPASPDPVFNDRGRPSRRTSRIIDPPDGRIPPLTPGGQKRAAERAAARAQAERAAAESFESFSLFVRCITRGLPGSMMPAVYGNSYQVLQSPGYVAIRYEMIHETRVIPLDGRAHVPPGIRSYMGDARGRWEGNTLVVETTNFRPEATYQGGNFEALRLIERFAPTGPDTLEWSVTIDDPTTWTRPWTFTVDLTRDPSHQVHEFGCHEGNYALRNMLTGARAEAEGTR